MRPSRFSLRTAAALAAVFVAGTALAAQAMARRPAVLPLDAPPLPGWIREGEGDAKPGPDELAVRWLGTAGFEIRSAKAGILIDPYYSRPTLGTLLAAPVKPDEAAIRKHVRPVEAVLVGHAHFDHLMDAPTAAKLTGATLYANDPGVDVAAQEGLPAAQRQALQPGRLITIGDLRIEPVLSKHSDMPTQLLAGGEWPATFKLPLRFLEYKNGPVYNFLITWRGRSLYHCGSADFDAQAVAGKRADVVMFCLSGWKSTPGVFGRINQTFKPAVLMPMHHDDFFKPFTAGFAENPLAFQQEAYAAIRAQAPGLAIRETAFFDDTRLRARDAGN